ncbi:NUDIX domain-containing protein [Curvibacter sp. APW13]|uniref:NUDIX domain-containing protein n=1 Tax=Curvibacter sp. APW13 TaxID=3077236 RepID=UPI0028DE1A95|nr:NUDIX domain-containing protein [Curvibacter sp. APW13]MDT8989900.1 NUDIX domain-containing protein [Curvibacter sp. APW13]
MLHRALQIGLQDLSECSKDDAGAVFEFRGVSLTESLEQAHSSLVRAQLAPPPGQEKIDVWQPNSRVCIGQVDRQLARLLGMEMHSAHLLVVSDRGICLQQRALHKAVDPGLWDTTVGGTCIAGESPEQTLVREMYEEAGLVPSQLLGQRHIGDWHFDRPAHLGTYSAWQNEHIHVCVARLADPHWVPLCHDEEVMAFAWYSLDDLQTLHLNLPLTHELRVVVQAPQFHAFLTEVDLS